MNDETHTFALPETEITRHRIMLAVGLAAVVGYELITSGRGASAVVLVMGVLFLIFFWRSVIDAVLPPTLTIDRTGVTWTRQWMRPLVMPWTEITRMRTGTKMPLTGTHARPESYYIDVYSTRGDLRIREGVVNGERDLDVVARALDDCSARFGTGLRLDDEAELVPPGPVPRILQQDREGS